MIETVFRSDDVPAADRLDYFREMLSQSPAPVDVISDDIAAIQMHKRNLRLDDMRVWTMDVQPAVFQRTAKLIRQSDPETYNICLLLHGEMEYTQGRQEVTCGPYDLHIHDSSRPFKMRADSVRGRVSCVGIEIPKRLVPLPPNRADRVIGRRMSGREGIGGLLAGFLTSLTSDAGSYRPADEPHLSIVVTDLVSALFAHILNEDDRLTPPESHRQTLFLRIKAFIRKHLHDPHLTRDAIAAAHHISISYLHRLFQADGITVMAWIRRQRLEHARRELTDPALHTMPIHQIASRWGFTHHTDFTRAFRNTYGTPPNDYRYQAFHPTPQP